MAQNRNESCGEKLAEARRTWDNRLERTLQGIKDKYYSYVDPVNSRKDFSDLMSSLRKLFDPKVFAEAWELSGFYVKRDYQRQGLRKVLLRWGLAQAAAEKAPVIVKSSPAGIKSYEQAEFQVFEKIDFGGSFDPGGRGINVLVWEPSEMEGQWYDRAKRKTEEKGKKAAEDALHAVTM